MASTPLARGRTLDAGIAWTATAALVACAAWFATAGNPDWAVFTLLIAGVAVVPSAVERDLRVTFPGELVALVAVPVVVRAGGLFPQATPFLAAAGLALLSAIALEAYTSLSLTPRFAVGFTVITTMAFAGAWAVGLWAADAFAGLPTLGTQTELMWDLVVASAMGVFAGVVFETYDRYTGRLARLGAGRDSDTSDPAPGGVVDADDLSAVQRAAVRTMQAGMGVIVAYALVRTEWTLLVNSVVPLAVTFLPALLRREYGYTMDPLLVLWVTLASALHAAGAVGFYGAVGWYDSLTHTVSASLVAVVGYAVARAAERHTGGVSFNDTFRVAFVLLFVLAAGVVWELLEFASGGLALLVGGEAVLAQYGAADIAKDLLFDAVGGLLVAGWSSGRFDGLAHAVTGPVVSLLDRD